MEQLKIDLSDIPIDKNYISASQKAKWGKALQKYCDTQAQTYGKFNGYCCCGRMGFCDLCECIGNSYNCIKAIKELANKKQVEIDYRDFDFEKLIKKLEEKNERCND